VADEVSASACNQLLATLEERRIPRSDLLRGLSLSEEDLRRPRGRISWSAFAAILDRAAERMGGPEALEQLGGEHTRRPIFPWFSAVARVSMSPRDLYWLGKWYGQSIFRNISCTNHFVGSNAIHQTLEIPADDVDCPAFFHLMHNILQTTPRLIGLPRAEVEMVLAPRRAVFVIQPPLSRGLLSRLFRKLWFSGSAVRELIGELVQQHEELLGTYRELTAAYKDLQEQVERRQRIEDELQQAQRLEAVGRLASGIAHDFNNVLTTVMICSDIAFEHMEEPDALRDDLARIREAASRAAGVTDKLLAFSRSEPTRPVVLDVNEAISQLQDVLRRLIGDSVSLETRLAPELGCVRIDPTQFDQVLLNLVLNARDAVGDSGRILVTTSPARVRGDEGGTAGLKPGSYAMLAVSDTGCGMDEETRARALEPFFTTKSVGAGTGLGLSIVHGIASQRGGKVVLTSEPGSGTTVQVYLPVTADAPEVSAVSSSAPALSERVGTVLLAEDDEGVRAMLHRILRDAGYRVVEAADGEQASWLALQRTEPIDLLVTDIRMPRVNGWALADALRMHQPCVPVLYLSGYPEDGASRHLAPNEAFLKKPFTAEQLCNRIDGLLA